MYYYFLFFYPGLTLVLYMELEEYLTGISQGYGLRLVVHEPKSFPFPADRGIYISPASEWHIGMKMVWHCIEPARYLAYVCVKKTVEYSMHCRTIYRWNMQYTFLWEALH